MYDLFRFVSSGVSVDFYRRCCPEWPRETSISNKPKRRSAVFRSKLEISRTTITTMTAVRTDWCAVTRQIYNRAANKAKSSSAVRTVGRNRKRWPSLRS